MLEKQRHQYLSALGIDQYVPTRVLTGAATSSLLAEEFYEADKQAEILQSNSSSENLSVSQKNLGEENLGYHSEDITATHPKMVLELDKITKPQA